MDVISIAHKKRQAVERYEIHVGGEQRDEYPQVLTEVDVTHEVEGTGPVDEAAIRRAHRAVGDQVLPGQRDALGRRDRGPPPLPDPSDRRERPYTAEGEVIVTGPYRRPDAQA